MLDAISGVILRPISFFRDLAEGNKVGGALWVVLLVALLGALSAYFFTRPLQAAFAETSPAGLITLISAVVGGFLGTLLSWLFYGLLVRIGAGMEAKPWAVTGYGLAPQLLLASLLIVIAVAFPVQVSPVTAGIDNPAALEAASLRVQQELSSSLTGRVSQILGYLGTLWWLALIFLGVRETAGQQRAVRSTLLVGVVALGFVLGPLLFAPL